MSGSNPLGHGNTTSSVQPLFGDRAASPRSLVVGELSFHIVSLLRTISSVSNWGYAISSVAINILNKVRVMIDTKSPWSATLSVEALGAMILLGESYSGPYLGATASSYFGDVPCNILSVNRVLNNASVLSWNAATSRRQLSIVRLNELTAFTIPFSMDLKHALLCAIIDLLGNIHHTNSSTSFSYVCMAY